MPSLPSKNPSVMISISRFKFVEAIYNIEDALNDDWRFNDVWNQLERENVSSDSQFCCEIYS